MDVDQGGCYVSDPPSAAEAAILDRFKAMQNRLDTLETKMKLLQASVDSMPRSCCG